MSVTTVTLWRCRLCRKMLSGEAFHQTPHAELSGRINAQAAATRFGVHECSPGMLGFTELVGARVLPEQEPVPPTHTESEGPL